MTARLIDAALEALSPTRCAGCERPGSLICDDCLARLTLIDPVLACALCGAPFGADQCTECRGVPGSCDRVLAGVVFEGPAPRIVRAYKDAGEQRLAPLIAQLLLDIAEHAEEAAQGRYGGILSRADALAFVPATARAYRRRGFDHMGAIAHEFAALSGKPLVDVLIKHGAGEQRVLGRGERLAAGESVYELVGDVRGLRLLLLDDVVTTGATLSVAAGVLRAGGAAAIDGLAFARVW